MVLAVDGLSMGTGGSEGDRVLGERLMAVEWRKQELPEPANHFSAGTWLLVSTSDTTDILASELTDALKLNDADVTTMSWPQHADHLANAERLTAYFGQVGFSNVVVVEARATAALRSSWPTAVVTTFGTWSVSCAICPISPAIRRGSTSSPGAQTVLPGERPNLEQAGLRGLLRVIGAEHPHLRPTQIDVDEQTEGRYVAQQLLLGSEEDETAFRNAEWYTAHLYLSPLRPDERYTTVVDHEREGMRLEIRTPAICRPWS